MPRFFFDFYPADVRPYLGEAVSAEQEAEQQRVVQLTAAILRGDPTAGADGDAPEISDNDRDHPRSD